MSSFERVNVPQDDGYTTGYGASAHGGPLPDVLDLTRKVFRKNGWLQERLGMEHRPQQERMAEAVAEAFTRGSSLIFEAGTGVGKSLAYLVPGLIYAQLRQPHKRKFIVSTYTILLEEQIMDKDIPICRKLFSLVPELTRFSEFEVAKRIGKANYLCRKRFENVLKDYAEELLDSEGNKRLEDITRKVQTTRVHEASDDSEHNKRLNTMIKDLKVIRAWCAGDECTGIRDTLPRRVKDETWERVNAESNMCSSKNCKVCSYQVGGLCEYRRDLEKAEHADLIIVNHSLLFTLISAGVVPKGDAPGILYADDFAVLDEAHRVPIVATDYFGLETSSMAFQKALARITSACKKGPLAPYDTERIGHLVADAKKTADEFFLYVRSNYLKNERTRRFREPDWAPFSEIPFLRLETRLKEIYTAETRKDAKGEIQDLFEKLQEHRVKVRKCLKLECTNKYVYWTELSQKGRSTIISRAPIDVAEELATHIFNRNTSVAFSSATLSDGGGKMKRFRQLCGADIAKNPVISVVEKSPFDYTKNMEVFVSEDCPAYGKRGVLGNENVDYNADVVAHCAEMLPNGGILVLCTNFDYCSGLGEALRKRLGDSREILVQGGDILKPELIRRFTKNKKAILIGNQTFWMGLDVPGPALSQVIIPHLPFANPSNPLIEARGEQLKEQGKSPFNEMSLPDAILLFRQGIGRLIRKSSDCGRLVLTDSNIMGRPFGKQFLAALPTSRYTRFTRDTLGLVIGPWTRD